MKVGDTSPATSCSGCPMAKTTAPDDPIVVVAKTWRWSDPITAFTGRFLDSAFTQDFQQTFRTARAWGGFPVASKNRIYFMLGSAVAAYDAPSFFSRLEGKSILMKGTEAPVSPSNSRPLDYENERFLAWDKFFYVENTNSGWKYSIIDRQQTMWGFDVDDRGYVYIAAADEGWGLVQDNYTNGGGLMPTVSPQNTTMVDVKRIISIKGSGGKYYALLGNGLDPTSQVWDVTLPGMPVYLRNIPMNTLIGAKSADHSARVCDEGLCIYENDGLVTNAAPQIYLPPAGMRFTGVTSDGQNFFAVYTSGTTWGLAILTPKGKTYSEADYTYIDTFQPSSITYNTDHLVLTGYVPMVGSDLYMIRLNKLQPALITFNRYFTYHYCNPPLADGYVGAHASAIYNAFPYVIGTKVYLVVSAFSLGDVYQVETNTCGNFDNGPTDITATASGSSVTVQWAPVQNAASYEVERDSGAGYTKIATPLVAYYSDGSVSAGKAYAYRVRALNAKGCVTSYSPVDIATTMTFTDDPIVAGQTAVRAVHFEELRTAANAVRELAKLPAATFTNASLSGAFVTATDLNEIRTAIDQALGVISAPRPTFTDSIVVGSTTIRASHINELRNAVK